MNRPPSLHWRQASSRRTAVCADIHPEDGNDARYGASGGRTPADKAAKPEPNPARSAVDDVALRAATALVSISTQDVPEVLCDAIVSPLLPLSGP